VIDDTMTLEMVAGREALFHRLLDQHGAAIRRLAASYEREAARSQDLVQDIWLAVWRALPTFRGDCSERTFVFRIAHNRGASHIQHWTLRRTETLEDDAPVTDAGPDPEQAVSEREQRQRLLAAVRRLPLGRRQAVALMLEGLSYREIADVLGVSENSVAVRITRARADLARQLGSSGADS
jgi:RNA polymerase sigma-70 factor (ECF subfamily)